MRVSGEEAKRWQAVRRDSLETVNRGDLVMADDETGEVVWTGRSGGEAQVTLGSGMIRLMGAYRYGR